MGTKNRVVGRDEEPVKALVAGAGGSVVGASHDLFSAVVLLICHVVSTLCCVTAALGL